LCHGIYSGNLAETKRASDIKFKKTKEKLTIVNKYIEIDVRLIISSRIVVTNESIKEY